MDTFDLTEEQLKHPINLGLDRVDIDTPVTLAPKHIQALTAICGEENTSTDTYSRIKASYGYGMIDALRLRKQIVENLPDLVLAPRSAEEIQQIIDYCVQNRISVYIHGGGSTVTRGKEAVKGGVTLDMSRHMNRVVSFNETDQTITVRSRNDRSAAGRNAQ